jgi:predicted porin
MKKSLFALAALGAFAGAAQAQSSVTLYGNIDASIGYIGNAGIDPTNSANSSVTASTATPSTASCTLCYIDGSIATSAWGMRGVEDLGGGLRATFNLEGDLSSNNAANQTAGLFRRASNVGLGGSFGTVTLGLQSNPLVSANSTLLPVMGNSVTQNRNVIGMATGDFINNAIGYTTPTMLGGLVGRVVYGFSNTNGEMSSGTRYGASLAYTTGGLSLIGAYNHQEAGADSSFTTTGSTAFSSAANSSMYKNTGYLAGIKYKFGNFTVGYGFTHGEFTQYGNASASAPVGGTSAANTFRTANANTNMIGVGYQATPAILLGLNYLINTADSSMLNGQVRYSLSKRTTTYVQGTYAMNGSGASNNGAAFGNYFPQTNTQNSPASNIGGITQVSGATYSGGMPNTNVTVINVGVIHSF